VYLGYAISGGDLNMDPTIMEAIMKWPIPTNVTKVRIFYLETQFLRKFIASFSVIAAPLHTIRVNGKSF
jgi:hypothetical protein